MSLLRGRHTLFTRTSILLHPERPSGAFTFPAHLGRCQVIDSRPPPSGRAKTPISPRNLLFPPGLCRPVPPTLLFTQLGLILCRQNVSALLPSTPGSSASWSSWKPSVPCRRRPPVECSPCTLGGAFCVHSGSFPPDCALHAARTTFLCPQPCPRPTRRPAAGPRAHGKRQRDPCVYRPSAPAPEGVQLTSADLGSKLRE